MIGNIHKITKRNLLKGIPWRFGPNWPGKRCEAKTRKGTPCQRPAKLPVGRCTLHGGASTGPRTEKGLKRLAVSKTKHGCHIVLLMYHQMPATDAMHKTLYDLLCLSKQG